MARPKKEYISTSHGPWTVVEELPSPDHNRRVRVHCTHCNRTKDVHTSNLNYIARRHKCQRPPMPEGTDAEIDLQLKARGQALTQHRQQRRLHNKEVTRLHTEKELARQAYETAVKAWKYAKEQQNEHARNLLQGTKPPLDAG